MVLGRLSGVYSGGTWFARGPEEPTGYPYCVFTVDSDPPELTTGNAYVQAFRVELAAYWPVGHTASAGAIQGIQQAFDDALLTTTAVAALQGTALRSATEKILASTQLTPTGDYERQLREGKDVFTSRTGARLVVQGDRSVS